MTETFQPPGPANQEEQRCPHLLKPVSEKLTPTILDAVLKGLGLRARSDPRFRDNIVQGVGNGPELWNARIVFRARDNSVVRHVVIQASGTIRSGNGDAARGEFS